MPGLYAYQASRRVYDNGQVAANVLGWVDREGQARGGIEQALNSSLTGTDGRLVYEKSLDGATIPTGVISETDPRDGCSIRLTIDRDLQWKAQQLLAAQVKASGSRHGYAVILDPRTFAGRALATVPTFDPNRPGPGHPGHDQRPEHARHLRARLDRQGHHALRRARGAQGHPDDAVHGARRSCGAPTPSSTTRRRTAPRT